MGVTTTLINKPFNPRGNDQSPLAYNKAAIYSGKALSFDGVNDEVTGTASVLPTGANPFTTCFYFNKDADGEAVFWGTRSVNQSNGVGLFYGNKVVHFFYGNDLNSSSNIENGKWYFVAVTFDGTTRSIYINGQLDVSDTPTGVNVTGTDYKLGYGGAYYHNGRLANTKVFNTALTAAQVADLYNSPEKICPTGVDNTALKLWLPMQEGAGTTAYDGSGNGNHGTISGATHTHGIGAPVAQTAVIDWNKGVNLLNSSELFSSAAWAKLNSLPSSEQTGVTAPDENESVTTRFTFSAVDHIIRQYIPDYGGNQASAGVWVYIENKGTGGTELAMDWGDGTGKVFDVAGYSLNTWYKLEFEDITRGPFNFFDISPNASGTAPNGLQARFWGAHLNLGTTLGPYVRTFSTAQPSPVLLPQGLTTGRDITGVNLFENVRKQGALNLDGNSWAEVHDNESLDITGHITLESWVYWDDSAAHAFLSKWNYGAGKASYLILKISEDNFRFYVSNTGSSAAQIQNTTTITSGWNHIVGVYDGTNIKCYLNGSVDGSTAYSAGIFPNDLNLEIGKYGSDLYPNSIAQPRIYNRALSAEEIQRNYDAGKNTYTN